MITRSRLVGVVLLVLVWGGWAGADPGAGLYETARATYHRLSGREEPRTAADWVAAAEQFAAVTRSAPRSARADDALYMVGLCRERAYTLSSQGDDRRAALDAYLQLAERYRGSNLADDALLRAGRIRELQGRSAEAGKLYRRVAREHPGADMVALAERRLQRLGRPARIHGVRSWSADGYTRVVIDLDHLAPFQANALPANRAAEKSARIYLDIANTRIDGACATCTAVGDGLVRQVRTAQHDPTTARVVLDLTATSNYRVFPLESPARIVVDVFRSLRGDDLVASLISAHQEGPRSDAMAPAVTTPLRIVLDPGHGGKDPGAVGPGGLYEKDVVLAVARRLATALRQRLRCEVKLTREDDRYLPLEQRTAIANAFGADLFISIHANASRSRKAKGIETYYLDRTSDRAARKMAARENASTEAGLAEVEHVLAGVLLASKIRDSRRLAQTVQETLVSGVSRSYGAVRDLGVKRGPFYVLTGAMMPAILIETSFITHPVESKRLASAKFRQHAAEAMAAGVVRYVEGT